MNQILFSAGVLSIIVGLIHAVLGEILIFRQLREKSIIPTMPANPLRQRNIRILWATWHIASIFGWGIGAVLINLAHAEVEYSTFTIHAIALSMFLSGLLVLIATKARHPGWVGLFGVAVLCWFS